jgi:NADP-dependent 3-hydroxy acid dehydrogenase YdfG
VSNPEQVQATISKVVEDFGKIDVFIANAGMAISKPILEQTLDEYDKQMSVNGESLLSETAVSYLTEDSQRCGVLCEICRRGV